MNQKPVTPFISRKQFIISTIALIGVTIPAFLYSWRVNGTHYPFRYISRSLNYFLTGKAFDFDEKDIMTGVFLLFILAYCGLVFLRLNDIMARSSHGFTLTLLGGTILAVGFDESAITAISILHAVDFGFGAFKHGALSEGAQPLWIKTEESKQAN